MTECLNCENNFEGSFCNRCGQKAATHRFSMHEWLHEIPHSLFHIDSGFFQTLKTLLVRPGAAVREYLAGRRRLLFSPFLYVLIWCGVFVVFSHFFDNPEAAAEKAGPENIRQAIAYIESHYYKILVVAMILPLSVGSFAGYYRAGYNFAEHLVLNAYLTGQLVIADIIVFMAAAPLADKRYIAAVNVLGMALKMPYWIWMYWQFFKPKKWYSGVLQFVGAQLVTNAALYGLLFGAAFLLLKFKGGH